MFNTSCICIKRGLIFADKYSIADNLLCCNCLGSPDVGPLMPKAQPQRKCYPSVAYDGVTGRKGQRFCAYNRHNWMLCQCQYIASRGRLKAEGRIRVFVGGTTGCVYEVGWIRQQLSIPYALAITLHQNAPWLSSDFHLLHSCRGSKESHEQLEGQLGGKWKHVLLTSRLPSGHQPLQHAVQPLLAQLRVWHGRWSDWIEPTLLHL